MSPIRQLLIEEEGRRAQPYYDSKLLVTVGVGHLCDPRRVCPMPEAIIDSLLDYDIAGKSAQAKLIPGFSRLNEVQQAIICSMVFQMGMEPFDGDGHLDFKNFLAALAAGNLTAAAAHGLDSKWAKTDSPERAKRQMQMLASGQWIRK